MRGDPSVPEWTQLSVEPGYTGWIRLQQQRWSLPNGVENDWDVLLQGPSVAAVAVTDRGAAVLFDQFRVGPRRVLAEIPGGLVDEGEGPVDAGVRELLEETGYRPRDVFHAGGGEWGAASSTRQKHVIIASGCERVQDTAWESSETGLVHEIPLDVFVEHVLSGELSDAGVASRGLLVFVRTPTSELPDGMRDLQRTFRELLLP
jgi:ADP-ribose pyrophosphatase